MKPLDPRLINYAKLHARPPKYLNIGPRRAPASKTVCAWGARDEDFQKNHLADLPTYLPTNLFVYLST